MVLSDSETTLHAHAAQILRRARLLPPGADRNDLRQLAIGLRWLERKGSHGAQVQAASNLDQDDTGPGDR